MIAIKKMQVLLLHEPGRSSNDVVDIVKRYHDIRSVPLDAVKPIDFNNCFLTVIDADLRQRDTVNQLRQLFGLDALSTVPRLFVLDGTQRRDVLQAYSLGGQSIIARPLCVAEFLSLLRPLVNKSVEEQWSSLNKTQHAALKVSFKVLEDTMATVRAGRPLPAQDINTNAKLIIQATAHDDLTTWLKAVRDHHNCTFRHSMLVCGFLVSFAHLIGMRSSDLQMLAVAGILHDVGKALTPLAILDKPERLTDEEWKIMRKHASDGGQLLLKESSVWDAEIIDGATHHHEKLDGTGYPDGLKGSEVSDLVRMISIADVFSALVDKRSYKPAMTGEDAYRLMLGMQDHLDMPLVMAFEPIALRG